VPDRAVLRDEPASERPLEDGLPQAGGASELDVEVGGGALRRGEAALQFGHGRCLILQSRADRDQHSLQSALVHLIDASRRSRQRLDLSPHAAAIPREPKVLRQDAGVVDPSPDERVGVGDRRVDRAHEPAPSDEMLRAVAPRNKEVTLGDQKRTRLVGRPRAYLALGKVHAAAAQRR
jgi:hypothetical protein